MTLRTEPWPAGTPCWTDLMTPDPEVSAAFYAELLGWQLGAPGERGYRVATVGGAPVAGLAPARTRMPVAPAWTVYLATDDIDATGEGALAAGARTVVAPMSLGPAGSMGMWIDPSGCAVAAWQAGELAGFGAVDAPGAAMWLDLRTDDVITARRFYEEVFGLAYTDMGPHYALFTPPGAPRPAGGIGAAQPGAVPGWDVTYLVEDLDAACATAARLGGRVQSPPVAFEFGHSAGVAGPHGEAFGLMARA